MKACFFSNASAFLQIQLFGPSRNCNFVQFLQPTMFLEQITIANYKNIEQATLRFTKNVNCFIGDNGMGKTNLLDAIYYLSFCKSSLRVPDSSCVRHEADFLMVQGSYRDELGANMDVTCSLRKGHRKRVLCNGKAYSRYSEHIGKLPLVMISPADSLLVSGGSEERRKFMNIIISQYDRRYLESLIKYENALRQRNAMLKSASRVDSDLMSILEEGLSAEADYIFLSRKKFVEEFNPVFQEIYGQICNRSDEQVLLEYESYGYDSPLLDLFRSNREKEKIVGFTLYGIHKDDLNLFLNAYPVRREGSQGQAKTYFIAMKLAQFIYLKRKGHSHVPLLLLDDIFDKLDTGRVGQIIRFVSSSEFEQIFITDTNREHLDEVLPAAQTDYDLFLVRDGDIVLKDGTEKV